MKDLWMRTIAQDVGGREPPGEIRDRLEVEGAVFVVDYAVVEAGRLDDPRDPARCELLEPGPQRGAPAVMPSVGMTALSAHAWSSPITPTVSTAERNPGDQAR